MAKTSNIKLFTDILNMCHFGNQNLETKKNLQVVLSCLLKQAQQRCIAQMVRQKGRNLEGLTRETLKEEARKLMHHELQMLVNSKDFITAYQNIILAGKRVEHKQSINKKSSVTLQSRKSQSSTKPSKQSVSQLNNKIDKKIVKASTNNGDKKTGTLDGKAKKSESALRPHLQSSKPKQTENSVKPSKLGKCKRDLALGDDQNKQNCSNRKSELKIPKTPEQPVKELKESSSVPNTERIKLIPEKCSKSSTTRSQPNLRKVSSKSVNAVANIPKTIIKLDTPLEVIEQLNSFQLTRFNKIKESVEIAMRMRKTFTILSAGMVRRFLLSRGWVEKIVTTKQHSDTQQAAERMTIVQLFHNLDNDNLGFLYLRMLKSKLMGSHQVDLIWEPKIGTFAQLKDVKKPVYLNRLRKRGQYDYCSKIGLCRHMRNLRWNYRRGQSDVYFPRTYILTDHEMDDFVYDFRVTACMALLKWSIQRGRSGKPFITKTGRVPIDAFFFAVLQCIGFIKKSKDCEFKLTYSLTTWNNFIDHYHQCVYRGEHFCSTEEENVNDLLTQAAEVLGRVRLHRPELDYEGNFNVWILKPDQHSRGQGIHVCRRMCQIKDIVAKNSNLRYLIQKYIEKPLLIYNTKFDIRQWFLISSPCPLTVWMYTECYLRFSSQQYQLTKFHESIHLTNNSVQSKYRNNVGRDPNLPKDNMWDSHRFEIHLKSIGYPDVWKKTIYPKMKQAMLAVLLSAKDDMEQRPYSFELYGADFMVTPDFQPWLIEVNAHPAMGATTSITARMCPEVMEDVVRVITGGDRDGNKGKFELIYKDKVPKLPPPPKEGFLLNGKPLSLHYYKLIDTINPQSVSEKLSGCSLVPSVQPNQSIRS